METGTASCSKASIVNSDKDIPDSAITITYIYVVGSKSFRPDKQKPRQMKNAVRDI